ncbi:MAG: hypothetical protein FJ221_01395 [Lentisphaerae bacterium]|nr:hypothetical protein [Lentisphaerota bacterium]
MATSGSIRTYVFPFGPGSGPDEADPPPTALLGGTGAAMDGLSRDRLPVPPGFTISAEVCSSFARHGAQYPAGVWDQIRAQIRRLEGLAISGTDEGRRPLVLAVRVDAGVPLTVAARRPITIGFGDRAALAFGRATGSAAAAWRGYADLIRAFGELVEGVAPAVFDAAAASVRTAAGSGPDDGRALCDALKRAHLERIRRPFPQELAEQLRGVLGALFDAWALSRQSAHPPARSAGIVGAAVTVTTAVFGDLDAGSASGVAWSRNPEDGSAAPSGRVTLPEAADQPLGAMAGARDAQVRAAHSALRQLLVRIERRAGQPQEVEFVVEKGRLWIVHARVPRRAPAAGLRWAAEMAGGRDLETGRSLPRILTPDAALLTVGPSDVDPVPVATSRGVRDPARRAFDQVLAWTAARTPIEILCHAGGVADARAARDLGATGIGRLDPASLLAAGSVAEALAACRRTPGDGAETALRGLLGDLFEQILSIVAGHPVVLAMPPEGPAMPPAARAAVMRAFAETALRLGRRRVRPRVAVALDARTPEAFEHAVAEARAAMDLAHRASRTRLRCPIGAVLPVPRAVIAADAVAGTADFLVLPVRELDGWMRGRTAPADRDADAPPRFDAEGLGALIEAGLKRARTASPALPCTVAVEDAPDAALLRLCLRAEIRQVVCPPAKIPAARLAAAQAAIRSGARQF